MTGHAALFVFSVAVVSVSQLLLKQSADRAHPSLLREYLNWRVITAYALFLVTTLMVIFAFRVVPLKAGPVFQSLGYIFVLVLERLFLRRRITGAKLAGIALIVAGVIIFSLG